MQGKIHDIGLLLGGALNQVDEPGKQLMWKCYRYLNVIHGLTYVGIDMRLANDLKRLVAMGLLTKGEVEVLKPAGNKVSHLLYFPYVQ